MMAINCSVAAVQHLYKYKKGLDEGFFEPVSEVCDTVSGRQERASGNTLFQWGDAVKIGRATCLISMELKTRWVHVIHRGRKGDVNGFFERLNSCVEGLNANFSLIKSDRNDTFH